MRAIILKGKKVTDNDLVRCVSPADGHPIFKGMLARIIWIERNGVALQTDKEYDGWHSFDGDLEENTGYLINHKAFLKCFEAITFSSLERTESKLIEGSISMCTIISEGDSNDVLVEFDEDIGGNSGDGVGKQGHCLLLNKDVFHKEKPKSKEQKGIKIKKDGTPYESWGSN